MVNDRSPETYCPFQVATRRSWFRTLRSGSPHFRDSEAEVCVHLRHFHDFYNLLCTLFSAAENEPLIPADTPFLLTTNPKCAEEALNDTESGFQINVVANNRYFDRVEVLKAFREQAIIQTPEYEAISESISGVGGRLRPRNWEEVRLSVFH